MLICHILCAGRYSVQRFLLLLKLSLKHTGIFCLVIYEVFNLVGPEAGLSAPRLVIFAAKLIFHFGPNKDGP